MQVACTAAVRAHAPVATNGRSTMFTSQAPAVRRSAVGRGLVVGDRGRPRFGGVLSTALRARSAVGGRGMGAPPPRSCRAPHAQAVEEEPSQAHVVSAKPKPKLATTLLEKMPWLVAPPMLALGGFDLNGPGSTAQALAVLGIIVAVHELGHFSAARLQNIYVTKFAVGFGPTLLSYTDKDDVEYSLRAVPLGGYVAFPDDDPESDIDPEDPNLLRNRPVLDRMLVVSAGVIANIIFAYTILFTQANTVGVGDTFFEQGVAVPELLPVSAAQRGGMQEGDIILAVDGIDLGSDSKQVQFMVDTIRGRPGEEIRFHILRGKEELDLTVVPDKASDGGGRIGVQLGSNVTVVRRKAQSIGEATQYASQEFMRLTSTVTDGLKEIVFNFSNTADQVSGPVAIIAVGSEIAQKDKAGLFSFAAIVNINLAVVNTLPLPALDGGYFVLLLVEALRGGKKLDKEVEQVIMSSGFLLLFGLGGVLILRDTLKLLF